MPRFPKNVPFLLGLAALPILSLACGAPRPATSPTLAAPPSNPVKEAPRSDGPFTVTQEFGPAYTPDAENTATVTMDYAGSTPTEGSGHFDGQDWKITLDVERCDGVFRCWEVCPEACFEKLEDERKVALAHDDRCIRCGACVVQCPQDALFFEDASGARIEPDVIRKYKLNLLGRRSVDAG